MLPRDLVELADLNLCEAAREMARWHPESEISEAFDLLLLAGADPFPVGYTNAAFPLARSQPAAPQTLLEDARRYFSERQRGYTLWTRAHLDGPLESAARAAGLTRVAETPCMVLEGPAPDASLPSRTTLRFVHDVEGARDFAEVAARAYATTGMPTEVTARIFENPQRVLRPHVIAAVARHDGEPVSAALALLSHGIAGVYWVGTAEPWRRHGLGAACTRAVGNAAFARGATAVVLQASRQGESVYGRLGYREITRYAWYVDFSAAA
jgi:hypothetical protein